MPPDSPHPVLPDEAARDTPPAGVLLFGGTFDPVHRGHTELAFAARELLFPSGGGRLVFVPAAISPHKATNPTPGHHRVEMIRLACQGQSQWAVWTEELDRAEQGLDGAGPSYWVDTLETASATHGDLSFLIGADQALAFNRWHEWHRILKLAKPVVIARGELRSTTQLRDALTGAGWSDQDAACFLGRAVVLETPIIDVNATAIRARLSAGENAPIAGLDPVVHRYAIEHRLY